MSKSTYCQVVSVIYKFDSLLDREYFVLCQLLTCSLSSTRLGIVHCGGHSFKVESSGFSFI